MKPSFPTTILYGGDYNPEQWSEDIWLEDMRLMQLAKVNMVSINIFSWAMLEPKSDHYHFEQLDRIMDMLAQHGIAADLATATASPPTWMSRLYPSMLPLTRDGKRLSHGSRQHYCPNSPDYRRKAAELAQRLAERYATHPALQMWHINNEYGAHTSRCYCDNCAEAFRAWLQERYHSLERLNEVWGTTFWSQHYYHWEDILPPRISPAQNNPGQALDYWRFMSDSLLGCYRNEAEILRSVTPDIPLTTNLMVAFKPVDGFAWAPFMDIISFDLYPSNTTPVWSNAFAQDVMRSLKRGQPHLVMEQSPSQVNWKPQNPHKRPGRLRLQTMQAIAHGADGAMYFQWRQSQAGAEKFHSAVVSHEGSEHGRIFRQAVQIGAELQQLSPEVVGSRISAQAAILLDWQNWWAVEYQPGPSNLLNYWQLLNDYYRALYQLNVAVDIAAPDGDLSGYRLIIAPLLYMLRPGVAENLKQFVERGGTLLTTFFSGIVDENDHVMLGGYPAELRQLLGIHVEEFDPWTAEMTNAVVIKEGTLQGDYPCTLWGEVVHLEGAQTLGVFANDYYANGPALTIHQFGQGHAYYLATHGNADLLGKLVRDLCQQAQVSPVLEPPIGIEATKRVRADGREIFFLLNHTELAQQVKLPAGTFTSLLDGKTVEGSVDVKELGVVVLLS
ncbi:MAG TPA: beta-galactosidase [Ktedonosporobacter sp.]|jgi:beta-galactosidase|nr:beta-galactosidase [Ktedonosporobacter sp.]